MRDTVQRLMTFDGSIRAVTVHGRDLVQRVLETQEPGDAGEMLGELVMAAVLVREAMAPDQRVQVALREANFTLVADSITSQKARGWLSPRGHSGPAQMVVSRILDDGQLHEGAVDAQEGVSQTVTHYMLTSEQILSSVGVYCAIENGVVRHARGFLVQILPSPHVDTLTLVTQALEALDPRWFELDDVELAHALLGQPARILGEHEVAFGCTCSQDSVLSAVAATGYDEIQDMVAQGKPVEVICEYCKTRHEVPIAKLKGLLA